MQVSGRLRQDAVVQRDIRAASSQPSRTRKRFSPHILEKYKEAGVAANAALEKVLSQCVAGARTHALCKMGDEEINKLLGESYQRQATEEHLVRGVCLPTCVSIAPDIALCCPLADSPYKEESKQKLKNGDVVHVELGAHIDGYMAIVGRSIIVGQDMTKIVTDKASLPFEACDFAAKAAISMLKPGVRMYQVKEMMSKIAEIYECNLCDLTFSQKIGRFDMANTRTTYLQPGHVEMHRDNFTFEENQLYVIDIAMSTGPGKLFESPRVKTNVFQRVKEPPQFPQGHAARALYRHITDNFALMPFTTRDLTLQMRSGVRDCVARDALIQYEPLSDKSGSIVARVRFTVMLHTTTPISVKNDAVDLEKKKTTRLVFLTNNPLVNNPSQYPTYLTHHLDKQGSLSQEIKDLITQSTTIKENAPKPKTRKRKTDDMDADLKAEDDVEEKVSPNLDSNTLTEQNNTNGNDNDEEMKDDENANNAKATEKETKTHKGTKPKTQKEKDKKKKEKQVKKDKKNKKMMKNNKKNTASGGDVEMTDSNDNKRKKRKLN